MILLAAAYWLCISEEDLIVEKESFNNLWHYILYGHYGGHNSYGYQRIEAEARKESDIEHVWYKSNGHFMLVCKYRCHE